MLCIARFERVFARNSKMAKRYVCTAVYVCVCEGPSCMYDVSMYDTCMYVCEASCMYVCMYCMYVCMYVCTVISNM